MLGDPPKKIHVIQHVPFEGPGNLLAWAKLKGNDVSITHMYDPAHVLPPVTEPDIVVVLGGPMGVYDEAAYPWLIEEKTFMRQFIDTGKPLMGICLGAQLAADVLGARVYPNPQKEIGWFPVRKIFIPHPIFFDMADGQVVLHWHKDTFDLPKDAIHLVSSEACPHQAFIWKEQVLGVQFHMEIEPEHIELLIENCFRDLKDGGPFVQNDVELRKGMPHCEMLAILFDNVMTRFAS